MIQKVIKGLTRNRDFQTPHVGEIRFAQHPRMMNLGEIYLFGRSFRRAPDFDPTLQGAQLAIGKPTRIASL